MLDTVYFVSWYIHNKTEGAWNGTIVDKFDNLSAAKKSYHSQLSMYIDDPDFDSVAVILTDSFGNRLMGEWWEPEKEPSPQPDDQSENND